MFMAGKLSDLTNVPKLQFRATYEKQGIFIWRSLAVDIPIESSEQVRRWNPFSEFKIAVAVIHQEQNASENKVL